MREIFIELIEHGLEHHEECQLSHESNEITKEALKKIKAKKGIDQSCNCRRVI